MLGDCHFCYHINSTKFIIRMHLRMCLEVLLKTGALIRLATKPFGRVELGTMGRFLWRQFPFTSCRWQAGVRVRVRSLVLNILCPIFLLTNQQFHTLYPWHIDIFPYFPFISSLFLDLGHHELLLTLLQPYFYMVLSFYPLQSSWNLLPTSPLVILLLSMFFM